MYRLAPTGLSLLASFLDYVQPRRALRTNWSALASRNGIVIGTDGRRFIALYRTGEADLAVFDLEAKAAHLMHFAGPRVRAALKGKRAPGRPHYATVVLVSDICFGPEGHMWAFLPHFGLVEMDPMTRRALGLYECKELAGPKDANLYQWVAVGGARIYFLSSYLCELAICSR